MSIPHVATVDKMDDGVLVTFTNDVTVLFAAETLWNSRHLGEEKIGSGAKEEKP